MPEQLSRGSFIGATERSLCQCVPDSYRICIMFFKSAAQIRDQLGRVSRARADLFSRLQLADSPKEWQKLCKYSFKEFVRRIAVGRGLFQFSRCAANILCTNGAGYPFERMGITNGGVLVPA